MLGMLMDGGYPNLVMLTVCLYDGYTGKLCQNTFILALQFVATLPV